MILIITKMEDDRTVVQVHAMLRAEGAEVLVLGPESMERNAALRIGSDATGRPQALLCIDGRELDLARDITSAWIWRSWRPEINLPRYAAMDPHSEELGFHLGEWAAFYKGVTMALITCGVFCVNPPPFHDAFEEKCAQMLLAATVGMTIPDTLYAADLTIARDFCLEHNDDAIYKPFRPFFKIIPKAEGEQQRMAKLLTNRINASHFAERQANLPTPGIFQPYVEKSFEIRIVVVGRELFTCAIHSQSSERSREDWRRYDLDNTPYEPYTLPAALADSVRRYMDRLGLVFGSIDMIVTPAGEHIFLEINPNGQFDWIARLAGLPIYEHLTAMLQAGSIEYQPWLAKEQIHAE